jgi:hypothetical protein
VWNGKGANTALSCAWQSGGSHGTASGDIGQHLTEGDNYVIFVLYNKVYEAPFFLAGGKWSYTFELSKNGAAVWSQHNRVNKNTRGIKFWKVFKVNVSSTGRLTVDDDIEPSTLDLLKTAVAQLEGKLNDSLPVARPF